MKRELLLLQKFSEAHGVSGFEQEVREVLKSEWEGIGMLEADKLGSIACRLGDSGPKVMIAAHMDEIGFMVQNISADGFISIVPLGGWWAHNLLGQLVEIKTRTGRKIEGVIGSKPPHFLSESQRNQVLPMDALFVDIGAKNRDQVEKELGVSLGDPIAPKVSFSEFDHSGRVMGKAFDNRAGLAAMVEVTKRLNKESLPNQLLATATVQEEVGIRGAKTAGAKWLPDCAIILEGPPADDTPGFSPADSQGKLGGGVQIRLYDPTAITNPKLAQFVEELAKKSGIPYQLTVRKTGGTDAGALHLVQEGVPCIVLGIPTRYIHAHRGVLEIEDYRHAIELTELLIRSLDQSVVASFTDYLS